MEDENRAEGKAIGGKARAEKLTPERRKEIAQQAATVRWRVRQTGNFPKATHTGILKIGDTELECAVLSDGTRVLSQRAVYQAIGMSRFRGAPKKKDGAPEMPPFLAASNINVFISDDLGRALTPIQYAPQHGGRTGFGYKAEILPEICSAYLDAAKAKVLKQNQLPIAEQCEILIRGFAKVGIIALIDEATGYQAERDNDELQRFLALYLSEERLKWAKMFPNEYYKQLFRLRNWIYSPLSVKRPKLVGYLTNKLVYEKLPANVIAELRRLNPVKNKKTWRREGAFFQHLSTDIGQPDLRNHLLQLIAVMRVSTNWPQFMRNFNRLFPPAQGTLPGMEAHDDLE
jgi:hypothetical protein